MEQHTTSEGGHLRRHVSPAGAWALSLGATIGWGSMMATGSSYLLQAGPLGSILGLIVGAGVMLVIAANYHYLVNRFPDAGGAYTYAKEILGYDYGFITAWFLALVYLAVLWSNATALPLYVRSFFGDVLMVGHVGTVFGYDVYLGEALLSMAAVALVALVCSRSRRTVLRAMVAMAAVLTVCILGCLVGAVASRGGITPLPEPQLIPDMPAVSQVARIAAISSWAFIGFESVTHFAEEYSFSRKRTFRVMAAAVGVATVLYAAVMFLSTLAYPERYASWLEYLRDLPNLSGLEAIPAFYAAQALLGDIGPRLLMLALLCLVLTSLVGYTTVLGRLFHALAADGVLPAPLAHVSESGIPDRAMLAVALVSTPVAFLGRTAVGWFVDVTTFGATIIYGLVSYFTYRVARARGDQHERWLGTLGVVLMLACAAYLVLPSLLQQTQDLPYETYFIFALWGLLGFVVLRVLLAHDHQRRFGRSTVVWVGLLAMVMFVAVVWTDQAVIDVLDRAFSQLLSSASGLPVEDQEFVGSLGLLSGSTHRSMITVTLIGTGILVLASSLLVSSLSQLSGRARESEQELGAAREMIYTDPLTGLNTLARFREQATTEVERMRVAGERPVVVSFNLMGMRGYNDQHGRHAGDELLRAFSRALLRAFGEGRCCRGSEDSFFALATDAQAERRVQALFADFASTNGGTLPVRAGAYACADDDDLAAVAIDRARIARDYDRTTWQSRLTWYAPDMGNAAQSRLEVLDRLDVAMQRRWIRPYYQAVVSTATGRVYSEEALARWVDPVRGLIPPFQFIPVIEDAGLLHKVDLHMVACVVNDLATRRDQGVPVVPASVNVSLLDLSEIDVAGELARHLDEHGLPHDLVHIELTESAASDDPELLRNTIADLHAAGFEVWMDDFGSGYSSLNSLKDFDFDVVKLDMAFLRGAQDERAWAIIAGVIALAKSIGLRTLAEGVETEEQARRLTEAGCDLLQGYLYAKPSPLEEAVENIRRIDGAVG